MSKLLWVGAAVAALAFAAPGQALVVGTALTQDGAVGSLSDTSNNGPVGQATLLAQGFSLAAGDYLLTSLTLWGNVYSTDETPQPFSLSLYPVSPIDHFHDSSNASIPGPADGAIATVDFTSDAVAFSGYQDSTGYRVLKYTWTAPTPLSVHSDGTLFASIAGNSQGADDFYWMAISGGNFFQRDTGGSVGWADSADDGTLTFEATFDPVVAAVPEPATWAMMTLGFGMVGVGLRRGRGTKRSAGSMAPA